MSPVQPWEALRQIVELLGSPPVHFEHATAGILADLSVSELLTLETGLYNLRRSVRAMREIKIEQDMARN